MEVDTGIFGYALWEIWVRLRGRYLVIYLGV